MPERTADLVTEPLKKDIRAVGEMADCLCDICETEKSLSADGKITQSSHDYGRIALSDSTSIREKFSTGPIFVICSRKPI